MPVSRTLRFVYIHVPKCAGTSVTLALNAAGAEMELVGRASMSERGKFNEVWLHHVRASKLEEHVNPEIWNSFFKFAFVRNPWDWLVSLYYYRKRGVMPVGGVGRDEGQADVEAFQCWLRLVCRSQTQGRRGASYYLINRSGELAVDFVGKYETLARDFKLICERLGIVSDLPHLNATVRTTYRRYYDQELIDLVAASYWEDIKRFGYTF